MTPKEYLSKYSALNARIDAKLAQAERLRHLAQSTGGHSDSNGIHSTQPYDKVGEITAKIVDLEVEINKEIDELVDLEREIRDIISRVSDANQRAVLEMKYISGWTLKRIANELNYSLVHTKRIHNLALKNLIPNDTF